MAEHPGGPQVTPQEAGALERLLQEQLEGHARLLALVRENRQAVARAEMDAIRDVCERQNTVGQRLGELEKQRLVLVGAITRRLAPDAAEPLKVHEIAARADGESAARLAALAEQLRPLVKEVREESSIVRQAADALSRHMSGVMQAVQAVLGRAQVYRRSGELDAGAPVRLCVDVTS